MKWRNFKGTPPSLLGIYFCFCTSDAYTLIASSNIKSVESVGYEVMKKVTLSQENLDSILNNDQC